MLRLFLSTLGRIRGFVKPKGIQKSNLPDADDPGGSVTSSSDKDDEYY